MPYDTEDRSAAYRRRVATPRADFVCKYCQRRFTKVSLFEAKALLKNKPLRILRGVINVCYHFYPFRPTIS